MRTFIAATFLIALAASVNAVGYTSLTDGQKLVAGDTLKSADTKTVLSLITDPNTPNFKRFVVKHPYLDSPYLFGDNPASLLLTNTGLIKIQASNGTVLASIGNQGPVGIYKLVIQNSSDLQIINSAGAVTWKSGIDSAGLLWGHKKITGINYTGTPFNATAGKGTKIYIVDGGNGTATQVGPGADHARLIARTIKVLAPAASYQHIQITADSVDVQFSQIEFIQSIQKVDEDVVPAGTTKIINLSTEMWTHGDPYTNCAVQWAASKGIVVSKAAGNDMRRIYDFAINQWQFVTGGVELNYTDPTALSNPSARTNWYVGLDMWAPFRWYPENIGGTSISTAFTTGAMAAAISRWPIELSGRPLRIYRYLKDISDTTLVNPENMRVVESTRSKNRFLNIQNFATPPYPNNYFNPAIQRNFCGELGLNDTVVDWAGILSQITFTPGRGYLVAGEGTSAKCTALICK